MKHNTVMSLETLPLRDLNPRSHNLKPGPPVIKLFSCSTQMSMKFALQIKFKLLTFASFFLLNIAEHENISANKYENANYCWHFHIY